MILPTNVVAGATNHAQIHNDTNSRINSFYDSIAAYTGDLNSAPAGRVFVASSSSDSANHFPTSVGTGLLTTFVSGTTIIQTLLGVTSGLTAVRSATGGTFGAWVIPTATSTSFTNTGLPVLSGTATVGSILTISNGAWSLTPDSYVYQWYRGATVIAGATASTYTLVSADNNQSISATVTAAKSGYSSVTAQSAAVTIGLSTLTNTTAPVISGSTTVGSILTVSNGAWSATPDSYTYQWRRGGTAISGATNQTYTVVSADIGQALTVVVTAAKANYNSAVANSNSVTPSASHDPSSISGLVARYRADQITGLSTGADITSWPDMSSNARTATSSGTAAKYITGVINGQPAVRFAGNSSTKFASSAPAGAPAQSYVVIMKPAVNTGSLTAVGASSPGGGQFVVDQGKLMLARQSSAVIGAANTVVTANAWIVGIGTYDSTAYAFRLKGTADGSGNNSNSFDSSLTTLLGNTSGGDQPFNGDIAEIFIFNKILSVSEQALIDSYAQDRYGITVSDYS